MQNKYYVYEWYIEDTGEIFYLGKGSNNRMTSMKDRNKTFKEILKNNKCSCRIVKNNLTEDEAFNLERDYGIFLKEKGLLRACHMLGNKKKFVDKETREKISNTLKGTKPWCYGKKNVFSEETLKRMSEVHKGTKQSEETKRKRSLTLSQKVDMLDLNGKYIKTFNSMLEAAKYIDRDSSGITKCIQGKVNHCGGYKWRKSKQGNTESV